jgi:hypothetical protein
MRLFLKEAAQFAAMSRNAGPGQIVGKALRSDSVETAGPRGSVVDVSGERIGG